MTSSDNIYKPKVSIIIPVYNVKPYLEEALNSVINQTYTNLEIILVDDGSDDGSENICEEYAKNDSRIKLIHRKNGGLSAARNTGLDNMTGEYVAFLDSDDVFLPEAIEKSLNAMLSNDVDCVAYKYVVYANDIKLENLSEKKVVPPIPSGIYKPKEALEAITRLQLDVGVWTKLTKRSVWENLRFPEGHVYEDVYLIPQLISKSGNIYVHDEVLIVYRKRNESITTTNSVKNLNDLLDSWTVFEKFAENMSENCDNEFMQNIRKNILAFLVLRYAKLLPLHFAEKSEIFARFKEKINDLEKGIEIKNYSLETKLAYYIIFNHPLLLSIFFLPCSFIYKYIRKVGGIVSK